MKIIAVGRNYANHAKELNNPLPTEPVIFSKPETALIKKNLPFFLPSTSNDVHHEVEVFIKICRNGKKIQEKFSHKYYDQIGLAIDFTARDVQAKCKEKGLPWDIAKGFDGSCPISKMFDRDNYDLNNLNFSLNKNGDEVQNGNTSDMIFSFDYIVSYVSQYFTIKKGDIILTGTPEGVGQVVKDDRLEGYLDGVKVMDFNVK